MMSWKWKNVWSAEDSYLFRNKILQEKMSPLFAGGCVALMQSMEIAQPPAFLCIVPAYGGVSGR